MAKKLKSGVIARCGGGHIGVITADEPQRVIYPDRKSGMAYVGIHLSVGPGGEPAGRPWYSRKPKFVAKSIDELVELAWRYHELSD